jgi:phosphoglycolate phosphatase-like HAD superfamily hydrolase
MIEDSKQVLLFDIDGTLLDPAGEGRICLERALRDVYGCTGPIDSINMAGMTDWQIITDLMTAAGLDLEEIEAQRPNAFKAYTQHVRMATPSLNMHRLPGVGKLLSHLKNDSTFLLGLVTGNVREAVPYKLYAVGIDPKIFTVGAFGSEHHDRNTLPALALYRLSQTFNQPIAKESVLIIGDTPLDIACARHNGVKVLCVATGRYDFETLSAYQPDYLLPDLTDTNAVMHIFKSY